MSSIVLFALVPPATAGAMMLTALVMVLTPGPNMIYLASRAVAQGRRAGLVSLAGTTLGFVVYLVLALFGLAIVFRVMPWAAVVLKTVGVVYLAFLAWKALRPERRPASVAGEVVAESRTRLFATGLVTNLLNPKSGIMYMTLIPQFVDPSLGDPVAQGIVLGSLQIAVSVTVNAAIVVGSGSLAVLFARRPAWVAWQRRLTGLLLMVAAVVLAFEVPKRAPVG